METFSEVLLLAVGDTPTAPLRDAAEDLGRVSGLTTVVSSHRLPLPDEAYDVRRGQTLAPRVLQRLRTLRQGLASAGDGTRPLILGVANADLFAPGLTFVFGQADTTGGVAIISLTRTYPAFYGRPHDVPTFRRRNAIEAVHEVGHLLGIMHCEDRHCVRFFSSTIVDSDRKGPLFCARCRTLADRAVVPTPQPGIAAADGSAPEPLEAG